MLPPWLEAWNIMDNLDFSEQEIQEQLAILGYKNIPKHKLREFKKGLTLKNSIIPLSLATLLFLSWICCLFECCALILNGNLTGQMIFVKDSKNLI